MQTNDTILYRSGLTRKNFGNDYRIFPDRIELSCRFPWILKTFVIRREDFVSVDVWQPPVRCASWRMLKLDLADLNPHVGIKRKNGFFKEFRFTPENPEEFAAKVREWFSLPSA